MKSLRLFPILLSLLGVAIATEIEYRLFEEQAPGTLIGNVADDANLKATVNETDFKRLRFEIMKDGNQYANWFAINEKTGQLETTEIIDRESVCTSPQSCVLSLDIFIYKESKLNPADVDLFQAFQVNIILEDLNDNDPTFLKPELSLNIPESSVIGYVLFISSATDPDTGGKNSVESYELLADDDTFTLQTPGKRGGNLGIVVNRNLDRETISFYRLKVVAKDGGQPPRTGFVMINVTVLDTNDNLPIFESMEYTVSIPENMPQGSTVLKVSATDNDIDENGAIMYRFSSRASEKVQNTLEVAQDTGYIKIKKNIDYETDASFQFPVMAIDKGATAKTAISIVKITILDQNDNAPKIHINLPPGGSDISESAEIDRYIAYFEAHDPDNGENGTVVCDIDNDVFRIEPISTSMYKIKLGRQLDRERSSIQNIRITCSDNGKPKQSNSTVLTIRVLDDNDNFPVFNKSIYEIKFPENNDFGDIVGMVTATDEDIGEHSRLFYRIEHDFDAGYFVIDNNSGLISANYTFDRENKSFYNFTVVANDFGQTSLTSSTLVWVTITDKNDENPLFSEISYIFYVPEGEGSGMEIGNVTVYDKDIGVNGDVSFLQDFLYTDVFVIDSITGKITTKVDLDRETKSSYIFVLEAQDRGTPARTSKAKIEIHVTDKNDNDPLISFPTNSNNTVNVPQTTIVGTTIARLSAADMDEGPNAELTYHIIQGDKRQIFRMNNSTGVITVEKVINENDAGTYTLLIAVQDNGVPQRTTWTNLVLIITDDDGRKNMIIAIAVATVTFALSAAMILTIFVIRRRDTLRENDKALKDKLEKKNNIIGWLSCLSSTAEKDVQMNTHEKVKDTNKRIDYGTDMQPIVPDTGSTSSEDSKSYMPGSNSNLTKIDNNLKDRTGEMSPREQDSGFGESLERRVLHEMKDVFPKEDNRQQYLDSRGIRIPSPYLDTSLPTRCWKKNDKPSYTRNLSLDEQMLREKEKSNVQFSASFNCRSDSGQNSELYTISEQSSVQRQPYGFHSLQRNHSNSSKSTKSKHSSRNASRRDLPPISATPEPEVLESQEFEKNAYIYLPYSLERHSQSDNQLNMNNDPYHYDSRLHTFSQSPRSETYSNSGRNYSPRSETYVHNVESDTYMQSSRSDSYIDNSRLNTHKHLRSNDGVILNNILSDDVVV